ncbi:hypothetical protein VNPA120840_19300 [Pseudomonas aeruginosa]|jgi:hypothetical protein|nr:hypothetical protein VNPA120840_19300 [Pseudomonas aeruginosa]GLF51638.1 hypothetical protein VNPA141818_21400 [Pseudomonas aeruginosa]GLF56421.1 hypothetical protein VNPA141826_05770 [Pseudomonas aeruginosa]
MASCTSPAGRFQSGCVAYCPAPTKILSGGCSTPNINWEINVSAPSGNGWYCLGSEDYGSGWYNFSVIGYAICAH